MGLDGQIEHKRPAEGLAENGDAIRLPTLSRNATDAIQPDVRELVADVLARELRNRERHISQERNRRVLGPEEIEELRGPLEARMRAGMLDKEQLTGFTDAVTHGGVPLELLKRDPLISIEEGLKSLSLQPDWLPCYLAERPLPTEVLKEELDTNQQKIVSVMQSVMRELHFDFPVFFFGSAARKGAGLPTDLDIGTNGWLRDQDIKQWDDYFSRLRTEMNSDRNPILGRKNHVGVMTDVMVQALAVSALRYGRALRVTPDQVFAIELAAPGGAGS